MSLVLASCLSVTTVLWMPFSTASPHLSWVDLIHLFPMIVNNDCQIYICLFIKRENRNCIYWPQFYLCAESCSNLWNKFSSLDTAEHKAGESHGNCHGDRWKYSIYQGCSSLHCTAHWHNYVKMFWLLEVRTLSLLFIQEIGCWWDVSESGQEESSGRGETAGHKEDKRRGEKENRMTTLKDGNCSGSRSFILA